MLKPERACWQLCAAVNWLTRFGRRVEFDIAEESAALLLFSRLNRRLSFRNNFHHRLGFQPVDRRRDDRLRANLPAFQFHPRFTHTREVFAFINRNLRSMTAVRHR